ncbi:MAG: ABC transporter permease [Spirochaetaceae bacterium]|nr:ABC transporter permease [Spirochaetaceae bacterium]
MKALYKKELEQYFYTAIGYVYLTIFLLVCGFYFIMSNMDPLKGDIRTFFSNILMFVMFIIPLLTMRSFSEERKGRTDVLLFTAPVKDTTVVVAKFLAALTVFCAGLVLTLLFVAILGLYGQLDIYVVITNYLGLTLAAAAYIGIGLFLSAKTESQLSAAAATYCVIFFLWILNYFKPDFGGGNLLGSFLTSIVSFITGFFSFSKRFSTFAMGMLNFSDILFYLSVTGAFLLICVRELDRRKDL